MAITLSGAADAEPAFLAIKAAAMATAVSAGGVSKLEIYNAGEALLLMTFNLSGSDPEFTSAGAVWSMDLVPAVTAVVSAGTVQTPAVWKLYDGAGALSHTGTCTGTPTTTGDVININSFDVTETN